MKIGKKLFFGIVFCFTFLLFSNSAQAATLSFSPSSKAVDVGDIINVSVYLNTANQAVNNVDAVINFPKDLLEIVSVSKSGSVFSIWVEEPTFSNSGRISFNGGIPNPGFNGASGKMIGIVFKAKSKGNASVVISSASIRANDGLGTDVLTGTGQAQFNLVEKEVVATKPEIPEKPEEKAIVNKIITPTISSLTHPDSNKWYSNKEVSLSWLLTNNTTGARLLLNENPTATPSVSYTPAIGQKTLPDVEDGIWYFHAQLRNTTGWGDVAHFKFQIDTEKPEYFNIKFAEVADASDPVAKLILDATDKTSGISHYEISINGETPIIWQDDGSHIFITPSMMLGKHLFIVKAYDKAGNYLTNSVELTISAIDTPKFLEYPKELENGSTLTVRGITYPNSELTIWVQRNEEEPVSAGVKSDNLGKFAYTAERKVEDGIYRIWAQVQTLNGARSNASDKINIAVKQLPIVKVGYKIINIISLGIVIFALIILLIFIGVYSWRKFLILKRKILKETSDVENLLHQAFSSLREEVVAQIKLLERTKNKRELTKEENKIIKRLKKHLNDAEKNLGKELNDIKKEIK